ncbi:choice-of-anchor J domain-containing protein, partial [Psychroserpens sp.]|uniref:choice-of-anchor J domain-containing protein n=1 Tax=Psychroserpens sp. TaxID=2020870 RepID=UPI0039E5C372
GMPNVWESQNGLNPNNASDRNTVQPDGYTNLEYFLNGMSIIGNTATGCSNEVLSFPYSESFENSLGDWTQSNTDDINWTVDADGTPSTGTGPSTASNGAYYVFVEASGSEIGFPTKQAVLNSPCFNLSGLSDANFSFKYHQSGSNDMGVIDLEASVDNGANWTSIWTSTGDKVDNWLTANVDLGAYVGASVKLRFNRITGNTWEADIAIDEVSLSGGVNTGSNNCSGAITSFPYTEGFENTLGAWTQSSVDDMDWTIDADGTPSGGTGPSSASENTYYVFVEASGNPTKQALLNSPCFDLSSLSDPNFSFKYHQYGSSDTGIIDLEASDDNGANWTSIWNSEGNLGNTWLTANIDLGAYIGNNVQLRFNRVIGNSYKADIAIDDVSLSEGISSVNTGCSEGITSFPYTEGFENTLGAWTQSSVDDMDWTIDADGTPSNGTGPSYAYQSAYYIFVEASGNPTKQALLNSPCFDLSSLSEANFSFKYHQYGSNDTGTIDLEASDDNGANWTSIWNSSGSIANTWLTANIDLGTYVGNNVQFRFNRVIGNSYKADIAIDDVSLSEGISNGNTSCLGEITSFPYTENFENTLGAWTQSSLDDIDWTVDADGTPSVRTGPSSASQGTHYIFVEASQNLTKQAILNSPCFDLSTQSSAQFSFDYHQFGSSNMGTINLEASDDNGISWASIWRSTGNLGDSWLTANIDLVAYVGSNVQLRFNRVTGSTWEADIAIDNINLSNGMATRETTVITTEVEVEVEVLHIKDITLYPNPVKGGLLNIKSTYTNISFEIYNMVGQLVSKGKVKNKAINVSNLNEGIYQIRFSSEGKTITKRFIKQ